ncbi:MAG TPA: VWA domain-containing protein [Pyrinomonadaceae bacterium]|nr:VWA domain-containing protein [Pyrinomonadaceae bacterium]
MFLRHLKPIFLAVFVSSLAASVLAQRPSPSPPKSDAQESVRVFTEEVRLPVVALDQYGHYDPTLELADLMVLEDGVTQQIRSVRHMPAFVLLLLDTGNQLGLKNTNTTGAVAARVVSALADGDRIAVMQFADRPQLLLSWTVEKATAVKTLKTKLSSGKVSRLADALVAASDQFRDTPPGARHIVLISDGVESPGGRVTLAASLRQLNSAQASVHIISYTILARAALQNQTKLARGGDGIQRDANPASNPVANGDPTLPPGTTRTPGFRIGTIDTDLAMRRRRKDYERATIDSEAHLKDIADESGGQMLLPASNDELLAQAESVARDIGSQYVVTYRPTHPLSSAKPGEYRRVEIASRRVGLYLRSRRGYIVPNSQ